MYKKAARPSRSAGIDRLRISWNAFTSHTNHIAQIWYSHNHLFKKSLCFLSCNHGDSRITYIWAFRLTRKMHLSSHISRPNCSHIDLRNKYTPIIDGAKHTLIPKSEPVKLANRNHHHYTTVDTCNDENASAEHPLPTSLRLNITVKKLTKDFVCCRPIHKFISKRFNLDYVPNKSVLPLSHGINK